jgi:predicted TIM-barrel fold metal-dependent hydrolase
VVIIDAQVHCYEASSQARPWAGHPTGPEAVTGDDQVAAMDALGVDAAILVSPWANYGFDPRYAQEVRAAYPSRFAVVTPVDPYDASSPHRVAAWAGAPGAVAIRIMPGVIEGFQAADPPVANTVRAAAQAGMPICLFCPGQAPIVDELARQHPDAQFVIDHLGLDQPMQLPVPDEPFAGLDAVLALAGHPNVAIKITGACTLSKRSYPFEDIWGPIGKVTDAFGIGRCMWGTDWTRAVSIVSHEDAVRAFRDNPDFSAEDRAELMGGTAQRIFGWPGD